MTRPVKRGTHRRSCRACGWTRTYDTPAKADYYKRRHSCDVETTRQERAARGDAYRARVQEIDRTPKPCLHKVANHVHGTRACYVLDKCRCMDCSKAVVAAENERRRLQAYGRYDRYRDAQPVRDHIAMLGDYGISLKQVGRLTGINGGALTKIVYGLHGTDPTTGERVQTRPPARRVTKETADKILSVAAAPENIAAGAPDPYRTHEARTKLRSLVRLGHSMSRVGREMGSEPSNAGRYFHGDSVLLKGTVDRALALFDAWSMTLPPQDTKWERTAVARARRYATEQGWDAPLDLEAADVDIELDGYIDEAVVLRVIDGDTKVAPTVVERREAVRRLHTWGLSNKAISDRAAIPPKTVGDDVKHLGLTPNPLETRHPIPASGGTRSRTRSAVA